MAVETRHPRSCGTAASSSEFLPSVSILPGTNKTSAQTSNHTNSRSAVIEDALISNRYFSAKRASLAYAKSSESEKTARLCERI